VVLSRRALAGAAVALAATGAAATFATACSQSLFDNHGAGATPGPGPGSDAGTDGGADNVPLHCDAPCLADAAADYDGTHTGSGNHWRYLDDKRNHTWSPMMVGTGGMTGVDAGNHIASCRDNAALPGCQALPGALVMSSAGATAAADPAIEFRLDAPHVIQLSLRAFVPGDTAQVVELYRNSREDVLFKGIAPAGQMLAQTIALDALAGDRFVFALTPQAGGADDVAVQLFASEAGAAFPSTCQLALAFPTVTASSLQDQCKGATFDFQNAQGPVALAYAPGPYAELGQALDVEPGNYLQGMSVLDQSGDLTVQFWMLQRNQDTVDIAYPFSDLDLDAGGGLGIGVTPGVPPVLDIRSSRDPHASSYLDTTAAFSVEGLWEFVRIVHRGDMLSVCVNGRPLVTNTVPAGQLHTTFAPYLGRNVIWPPGGAYYDGLLDDVRVLGAALPCNDQ
jgi:hypothetical protein